MRVQVYRNLNRKSLSVVALEGPYKGKVVAHPMNVCLSNCKFVVQPAGRSRVLREKRKNVHAFVRGDVNWPSSYPRTGRVATYNPYKNSSFVLRSGKPVHASRKAVIFSDGSVYCKGVR